MEFQKGTSQSWILNCLIELAEILCWPFLLCLIASEKTLRNQSERLNVLQQCWGGLT